jgi:hypothetical protein
MKKKSLRRNRSKVGGGAGHLAVGDGVVSLLLQRSRFAPLRASPLLHHGGLPPQRRRLGPFTAREPNHRSQNHAQCRRGQREAEYTV